MPKARHSVSSSSAHHYGSSSRHGDDDEDDDASRASTPFPTTYLNSLSPLNYQKYDIPTSSQQDDDLLFEVPPPPPSQESGSMYITLTLSPITPLDLHFNTPSHSPPLFGHPIPWNLLEEHGDSCLCCIHNRTLIFGLRDELQYMFSYIEHMLLQPPFPNTPPPNSPPPSLSQN
ncbi:hypothetical protein Tco_0356148 [Tanacetum coccineum]